MRTPAQHTESPGEAPAAVAAEAVEATALTPPVLPRPALTQSCATALSSDASDVALEGDLDLGGDLGGDELGEAANVPLTIQVPLAVAALRALGEVGLAAGEAGGRVESIDFPLRRGGVEWEANTPRERKRKRVHWAPEESLEMVHELSEEGSSDPDQGADTPHPCTPLTALAGPLRCSRALSPSPCTLHLTHLTHLTHLAQPTGYDDWCLRFRHRTRRRVSRGRARDGASEPSAEDPSTEAPHVRRAGDKYQERDGSPDAAAARAAGGRHGANSALLSLSGSSRSGGGVGSSPSSSRTSPPRGFLPSHGMGLADGRVRGGKAPNRPQLGPLPFPRPPSRPPQPALQRGRLLVANSTASSAAANENARL